MLKVTVVLIGALALTAALGVGHWEDQDELVSELFVVVLYLMYSKTSSLL